MRKQSDEDMRRTVISLDRKGLRLISTHAPQSESVYAEITQRFGEKRLTQLLRCCVSWKKRSRIRRTTSENLMSATSADGATLERRHLALARPDLLRECAYLDGEWIFADETFDVLNPATGRVLGSAPALGADHALRAVEAAHRAQVPWARRSAGDRSRVLRRWFDLVTDHTEDLARLLTAEQGKPLTEARAEIQYAASFIEWFAEEARRIYGDTIPGSRADQRITTQKHPVGVVAAITPWNFPAAMITRKVAPALAVGCTVVLKPSELTPFSAMALALLAEEAGVPPGVFSVITGDRERSARC